MNIDISKKIMRALLLWSALCVYILPSAQVKEQGKFEIGDKEFVLDGNSFVIKAAELHYPRIPMEYWDQRIKMCKALGMNTVCLYTFWNVHEPSEGEFNFSEGRDIRKFIQLCQENDMKVILRPGPYVCAEWEMGGLPWWLLKKKDISLRDNDPYFLERVELFEKALATQIEDLLWTKGGPIIMIQVENEYGSYAENKAYVNNIKNILRNLYGEDVLMFQCDWASNFTLNGLDDLVWTMNFGTGTDVDSQFSHLKELRPSSPLMCSEFWSGWFDKWGAPHETRPADEMVKGIDEMLSKNISFSLYMTHGGTNWGHWAGANSPGYAPDVTSYDYDAPINENGNPTDKYWLLREVLANYSDSLPPLPQLIQPVKVDTFTFTEVALLRDNMPGAISSEGIKTMEEFNQGYGSIVYTTTLPELKGHNQLCVIEAHDYAQIFINDKYIGKLDRRLGENELTLPECREGDVLSIFVEAMGRINFGVAIKDFKGITETVYLQDDKGNNIGTLEDWKVYLLPDDLNFYTEMDFIPVNSLKKPVSKQYPRGVYRGKFTVEKPSDTFLSFETWGKGLVYINGHPLGRIWNIGPQQTLYTPGVWLKEGENEVLVFDIVGPEKLISYGLDKPIIDKLQGKALQNHRNKGEYIDIGNLQPVYGGAFQQGNGWQRQIFDSPAEGRYLIIEAISPFEGDNVAIAELYLLNKQGLRMSREDWKIFHLDSEDTLTGNNTGEKIFDLQESTYWKSADGSELPQKIVIDLGKKEKIYGLEYLPRMEKGAPGAIKDYRIYISEKAPVK